MAYSPGVVFEVAAKHLSSTTSSYNCHFRTRDNQIGGCLEAKVREDDMGICGEVNSDKEGRIMLCIDGPLSIVELHCIVVLLEQLSELGDGLL